MASSNIDNTVSAEPIPDNLAANVVDLTLGDRAQADLEVTTNANEASADNKKRKKDKRKGRRGPGKNKGKRAEQTQLTASDHLSQAASERDFTPDLSDQEDVSGDGKDCAADDFFITPHPVIPHYEIRLVPAGEENVIADNYNAHVVAARQHGLYANADIPKGTRIICESPLIELPLSASSTERLALLRKAYVELDEVDQAKFWKAHPSPTFVTKELTEMVNMINPAYRWTQTLEAVDAKTLALFNKLTRYGDCLRDAITTLRLAARWHAGSYALPERSSMGLFIEQSILRHSCVPNCYMNYNSLSNGIAVHTLRDIAAGDELTVSHITNTYTLPYAARQHKLMINFGIVCKCLACTPTSPIFSSHEEKRSRLTGAVEQLKGLCEDMPAVAKISNASTTTLLPAHIPLTALETAETLALGILKDLRAMQWTVGHEVIECLDVLIDHVNPRLAQRAEYDGVLRTRIMGLQAKHVAEAVKMSMGVDNAVYAEYAERVVRVEKEIEADRERAEMVKESRRRIGG